MDQYSRYLTVFLFTFLNFTINCKYQELNDKSFNKNIFRNNLDSIFIKQLNKKSDQLTLPKTLYTTYFFKNIENLTIDDLEKAHIYYSSLGDYKQSQACYEKLLHEYYTIIPTPYVSNKSQEHIALMEGFTIFSLDIII